MLCAEAYEQGRRKKNGLQKEKGWVRRTKRSLLLEFNPDLLFRLYTYVRCMCACTEIRSVTMYTLYLYRTCTACKIGSTANDPVVNTIFRWCISILCRVEQYTVWANLTNTHTPHPPLRPVSPMCLNSYSHANDAPFNCASTRLTQLKALAAHLDLTVGSTMEYCNCAWGSSPEYCALHS